MIVKRKGKEKKPPPKIKNYDKDSQENQKGITTMTKTKAPRFTLNFANKTIVGTKASFDKASKGYGEVYDELVALMAKHPDFGIEVKVSEKPAKPKQTYAGMDIAFMLDYASAVGQPDFRTKMEQVRDFTKKEDGSVYPIVKRMFLEHFAPEADRRFAYAAAKEKVREYRYNGIITKATTHTEPVAADEGNNAVLTPAA